MPVCCGAQALSYSREIFLGCPIWMRPPRIFHHVIVARATFLRVPTTLDGATYHCKTDYLKGFPTRKCAPICLAKLPLAQKSM
eukprot:scaffold1830_cov371-Pavlova_lutheri.AAC.2